MLVPLRSATLHRPWSRAVSCLTTTVGVLYSEQDYVIVIPHTQNHDVGRSAAMTPAGVDRR